MRLNTNPIAKTTHEGAKAYHLNPELELRRTVMACMLWEKQFYESGEDIVARIKSLIAKVPPVKVSEIAIEARQAMKLRHVPLLIAKEMAALPACKPFVANTLFQIIERADELSEFMAIYWANGKTPISNQIKKGLAKAFTKFNEYQLAKYNRDSKIKLRDVLFMVHAKPKDSEQEVLWKKLINNELTIPDTWEVALSTGKDKKETWERLISEKKLGALALLRNLRNMQQASVTPEVIRGALKNINTERVLPFRFVAAAKFAPQMEPELERAMFKCTLDMDRLRGHTVVLVDVSGSMDAPISDKSDMQRIDAACALAMIIRELSDEFSVFSFSNGLHQIPPRRGFALKDAILTSQSHSGTQLGLAVNALNTQYKHDRLIVITDEQSADSVPSPVAKSAYVINVASYKNGIGYGPWIHIDGWSESVVGYITKNELPINH